MRAHTAPLLILLLGLNAACSPDRDEAEGAPSSTPEQTAASADHPCDILTLAEATTMFGVPEESVTAERGEVPGNSFCSYKWKKEGWEAMEERNRAAMMKAVRSGGDLIEALTSERSEGELFITFHGENFGSTAEAVQAFDAMVERLTRGISSTVGDDTAVFQASFDASEGIGAKAAWSDKLRQLSVASGTHLYHVKLHADTDPRVDRAGAEAVARKIAASLR
jgi:hypothetical protein